MFDPISLALDPPRFIKGGIRLSPARREPRTPFTWPLPRLGDRDPKVLATHGGERPGIELGYTPAIFDPELYVPVFAASDGEVAMALGGATGHAISIDHGTWTTYYGHLSKSFVIGCKPRLKHRELVRAGQVIGYAAKSPIHILFELWHWTDDRGFVAVDPTPHMRTWAGAPVAAEGPGTAKEAA